MPRYSHCLSHFTIKPCTFQSMISSSWPQELPATATQSLSSYFYRSSVRHSTFLQPRMAKSKGVIMKIISMLKNYIVFAIMHLSQSYTYGPNQRSNNDGLNILNMLQRLLSLSWRLSLENWIKYLCGKLLLKEKNTYILVSLGTLTI